MSFITLTICCVVCGESSVLEKMVVNSVRLLPGCRIFGSHGPLEKNPNASVKRRVRSKVYGTVLKAEGLHKWEVRFDFDGKSKVVTSKSLKLVPNDAGIPLNEESECSGSTTVSAVFTADTTVSRQPISFYCDLTMLTHFYFYFDITILLGDSMHCNSPLYSSR